MCVDDVAGNICQALIIGARPGSGKLITASWTDLCYGATLAAGYGNVAVTMPAPTVGLLATSEDAILLLLFTLLLLSSSSSGSSCFPPPFSPPPPPPPRLPLPPPPPAPLLAHHLYPLTATQEMRLHNAR